MQKSDGLDQDCDDFALNWQNILKNMAKLGR